MITAVTEVFGELGGWFTTQITNMTSLFYNGGELTLLGTLCIAGLGISIVLLILNMVKSFMRFR